MYYHSNYFHLKLNWSCSIISVQSSHLVVKSLAIFGGSGAFSPPIASSLGHKARETTSSPFGVLGYVNSLLSMEYISYLGGTQLTNLSMQIDSPRAHCSN